MIAYSNVVDRIWPNPGVGYWWVVQDGQLWLWTPPPEQVSVFWPVFVVSLLGFGALAFVLRRWLRF